MNTTANRERTNQRRGAFLPHPPRLTKEQALSTTGEAMSTITIDPTTLYTTARRTQEGA